jgi:hypothetical protein
VGRDQVPVPLKRGAAASPIRTAALGAFAIALVATGARAQTGIDGITRLGTNTDEFAHVMSFEMRGDRGYCAVAGVPGTQTYDVSTPANPTRVSSVGAACWRVKVEGDSLFSFCHFNGVQLFDITAGLPVLESSYNPANLDVAYAGGVRAGSRLYVAALQTGVVVLQIGGGGLTFDTSFGLADNDCWDVETSGSSLFVANGEHGLSVVDVSGVPTEVATLALGGLANDIVLAGTTAFLSLAAGGVAAVDVSTPTNPVLLDTATTLGNAFSMGVEGDRLAVGSYTYLELFDVSDPSNLVRSGWEQTPLWAMGADIGVNASGDTLIVVADWTGMHVYAPEPDAAPDIALHPDRVDFGAVSGSSDRDVEVRNNGSAGLDVSSVLTPAGFSVSPGAFNVPPGGTQIVTVSASGVHPVQDAISFLSNDPDEGALDLRVYQNNTSFPQVGSVAPDFTLPGTDALTHQLADYRGRVVFLEFGANW